MKIKILTVIIFFIGTTLLKAQPVDSVSIEDCLKLLEEYYPTQKNNALILESTKKQLQLLTGNFLPQISANAQATYQSEVTSIDIPIPGITMPELSKDQYKATIEVTQMIFDGGVTSASKDIQKTLALIDEAKLSADFHKIKELLLDLYFNALLLQENQELLNVQSEKIHDKIEITKKGIAHGILSEANLFLLEAESLKVDQQIIETGSQQAIIVQTIEDLTGQKLPGNARLTAREPLVSSDSITRPELVLLNLQKEQIEKSNSLYSKSRMPKIIGFGQIGYGKPGLNMLSDEFSSFYYVGAKLSWNIWDRNQTKNRIEINKLQSQMIDHQVESFILTNTIDATGQQSAIKKLEKLLEQDKSIIEKRKKLTAIYSSQLDNGTIRPDEYLDALRNETMDIISMKKHEVEKIKAKYKILLVKGQI